MLVTLSIYRSNIIQGTLHLLQNPLNASKNSFAMPLQKPIHSLSVYGSFGLRLEKEAVAHRQRLTRKQLIQPPLQWDVVKEGLDLFAVRTQRKSVELEEEQERMKVDVKEQNKLNESRMGEVHQLLHGDIHRQFIEINAFIRDCSVKEKKATEKIDRERNKQAELTKNIECLEQDLQKLLTFRGRMEQSVEEFKCFEDTVTQLVAESEHIATPKDFMDKCDALMMAQVEISEMETRKLREIEQFQRRLVQLSNDSTTDFLGLNNFLVDLDKAYDKAHSQGIEWEQVLVQSRDVIVGEEAKCTRIIDSTRQLYVLLCKRNGREPNLQAVSLEGQLDYIKDEIEILVNVREKATAFMATEEESLQGERGT